MQRMATEIDIPKHNRNRGIGLTLSVSKTAVGTTVIMEK